MDEEDRLVYKIDTTHDYECCVHCGEEPLDQHATSWGSDFILFYKCNDCGRINSLSDLIHD